ncbi:hypothetical protein KC19_5G114200 [Ceratodon purpureus]|uniref:Uncharacterized protein n=1 Tax=Ceratodon purpureus TaxID=3225 RepID=A0A8T0I1H4_CERPU|nr:hypothetical protein KC19_5G114200 [Ceratodon purpureus]
MLMLLRALTSWPAPRDRSVQRSSSLATPVTWRALISSPPNMDVRRNASRPAPPQSSPDPHPGPVPRSPAPRLRTPSLRLARATPPPLRPGLSLLLPRHRRVACVAPRCMALTYAPRLASHRTPVIPSLSQCFSLRDD